MPDNFSGRVPHTESKKSWERPLPNFASCPLQPDVRCASKIPCKDCHVYLALTMGSEDNICPSAKEDPLGCPMGGASRANCTSCQDLPIWYFDKPEPEVEVNELCINCPNLNECETSPKTCKVYNE